MTSTQQHIRLNNYLSTNQKITLVQSNQDSYIGIQQTRQLHYDTVDEQLNYDTLERTIS